MRPEEPSTMTHPSNVTDSTLIMPTRQHSTMRASRQHRSHRSSHKFRTSTPDSSYPQRVNDNSSNLHPLGVIPVQRDPKHITISPPDGADGAGALISSTKNKNGGQRDALQIPRRQRLSAKSIHKSQIEEISKIEEHEVSRRNPRMQESLQNTGIEMTCSKKGQGSVPANNVSKDRSRNSASRLTYAQDDRLACKEKKSTSGGMCS